MTALLKNPERDIGQGENLGHDLKFLQTLGSSTSDALKIVKESMNFTQIENKDNSQAEIIKESDNSINQLQE